MKRLFSMFCAVAVLAVATFAVTRVPEAQAANVFKFQLVSTDAGATEVEALAPQQIYELWCAIPACYKTDKLVGTPGLGGTGVVGDGGITCSPTSMVDMPAAVFSNAGVLATWNATGTGATALNGLPRYRFNSGNHTGILAWALDAGNPACSVSLVVGGGP